ncbi:MAG: hypothetical protein K6E51_00695 [Treponema sp.]|nr:hypothetical protein [Treponema sp.]
MTLNDRNHFFMVLQLLFTISCLLITGIFIYALATHTVSQPEYTTSIFKTNFILLRSSFLPTILSLFILLFIPLPGMYIVYRYFEKTQSNEVFFFACFLITCTTEASRLFLPCFDMWQTYSPFLVFIGRIIFCGRVLCPLFFLMAALLTSTEQHMYMFRNFNLLIAASFILASFIPLNTMTVTSSCLITWGYNQFFNIIQIIIYIITASSFFINAHLQEIVELHEEGIGFIVLIIGYLLLIHTDNYLFLVTGSFLLAYGIRQYLRAIHRLYLWK